ncbi:choice-of-anchor P family protein [Streptomyces triticagri]|uniref:choice-of-anchor P family protein n=1 Tax=Streptomyces triticagri TaxID=2293568 RepID=UPI0018F56057|nr:choice-of-anchor P family protein [Streptomyces triticagri]
MAGSLGTAHAAAGAAPPTGRAEAAGTTEVTYQGHRFTVPASWDVVDLEKSPESCVRFDRNAVYLGKPGNQRDCPAKAFGRTESLLIEPAAKSAAKSTKADVTRNSTARTYRATASGISVTAAYGDQPALVRDALKSADLPVDRARDAKAPDAAAPPAAKAALPEDATSFNGKGFDRCTAPSGGDMDTWKEASPYGAVGVYIGGINAGCGVTVDADWMQAQYDNGWRYFPIYVGPQADPNAGSCGGDCDVIEDPVADAKASAEDAAAQAAALGLPKNSVLYFNMEHYDRGQYGQVVKDFLATWTDTVHELGYRSGAYGSASSLATDLVEAAGDDSYSLIDVIDFARWDDVETTDDEVIPADLWADHQRIKQYHGPTDAEPNETWGGVTLDVDRNLLDVGEGSTDPPVAKDTVLEYTGPGTVSNGSPAELSATLTEEDGGAPVPDADVTLTIGPDDDAQECTGTTDTEGTATCSTEDLDQKLTDDATLPVTATFEGTETHKASETTADVKLQHVTGRAYALSAEVPLPVLPVGIDPTPDTGEVRTAGEETVAPECTQEVSAVVITAAVLCSEVAAKTGPSSVTASAELTDAHIGVPGLPVIEGSGLTAESTSSCTGSEGSTSLTLTIAGSPVTVPDTPNHTIDLGLAKIVTNEQTETEDGLEVTALHLTSPAGVDVTLGHAESAALNCA